MMNTLLLLVLLRAVPVEGETLKLEERMQHYGVAGVSVAAWKNGRLESSSGHGNLQASVAAKLAGTIVGEQTAPGFAIASTGNATDGAIAVANQEHALPLLHEILRGFHPPPARALTNDDLEPFVGRYAFDADDVVRFRMVNGRFVATRTGVAREMPLDAVGPNEAVDRDTGVAYVFGKDSVRVNGVTATRTRESIPTERIERDARMNIDYKRIDPALVTEERLRARGEMYLVRSNYGAALSIFEFNAERHPQSAAALDALARAQLAMNDAAGARATWQKVLEVLPSDTTTPEAWKVAYRKRAQQQLAGGTSAAKSGR